MIFPWCGAAGAKGEDGVYPPESLNGRVLARMRGFAERLKEEGKPDEADGAKPATDLDETAALEAGE